MKNRKPKVGDYLFWFVGDASPKRYKPNDKYFVDKYLIKDIVYNPPAQTLIIQHITNNADIDKSSMRWWYSKLAKDYEIQEVS